MRITGKLLTVLQAAPWTRQNSNLGCCDYILYLKVKPTEVNVCSLFALYSLNEISHLFTGYMYMALYHVENIDFYRYQYNTNTPFSVP